MNKYQIASLTTRELTGGYFYDDGCRINYSHLDGWYCKDWLNGKMHTYNISTREALNKIEQSLL